MNLLATIISDALSAITAELASLRDGLAGCSLLFAGPCRVVFASMATKPMPVTIYAGGVWQRETSMTVHAVNHATVRVA